jgi:hypothetical protein
MISGWTASDELSPTWKKIKDYYTGELHALRIKNDGDLDEHKTIALRGEMRMIRKLLSLDTGTPS